MIGEGLLGADSRPYFWGAWDRLRFAFASRADEGEFDEGTSVRHRRVLVWPNEAMTAGEEKRA